MVFHALRNLTRMAKGTAGLRWSQLGFGRTSTTSEAQETPRNLPRSVPNAGVVVARDSHLLDERGGANAA